MRDIDTIAAEPGVWYTNSARSLPRPLLNGTSSAEAVSVHNIFSDSDP